MNMNNAVVILTRGYSDLNKYDDLLNRNISIQQNLNNKSIEIIIFHENNIDIYQQNYIKSKTPLLNIIFISILEKAFKKEKSDIDGALNNTPFHHYKLFIVDFFFNRK